MMPAQSHSARASAMAEMDGLMQGLRTEPRLAGLLARADAEPLDAFQHANLREIRRDWRASNALPAALIEARSLAAARCEHAWRSQRPANDWAGFLGNFREVLRLGRETAQRLSDATGLAPYDALMDQFEPGMTGIEVDRVFGDLQQWLPGLVQRVRAHQSRDDALRGGPPAKPGGPFPVAAQRALNRDVLALLGFDFEAGRLDESAHPFSGGVSEDTRLTTRYSEASLMQGLMGTVHETGHGRYEQNLPREWLGQPVANPRSMAIHESQSRSARCTQRSDSPRSAATHRRALTSTRTSHALTSLRCTTGCASTSGRRQAAGTPPNWRSAPAARRSTRRTPGATLRRATWADLGGDESPFHSPQSDAGNEIANSFTAE